MFDGPAQLLKIECHPLAYSSNSPVSFSCEKDELDGVKSHSGMGVLFRVCEKIVKYNYSSVRFLPNRDTDFNLPSVIVIGGSDSVTRPRLNLDSLGIELNGVKLMDHEYSSYEYERLVDFLLEFSKENSKGSSEFVETSIKISFHCDHDECALVSRILRVSILPGYRGVDRLLYLKVMEVTSQITDLRALITLEKFSKICTNKIARMKHGLIVLAGQGGMGKTTTAYSILKFLSEKTAWFAESDASPVIYSIENSIEYLCPWMFQVELNDEVSTDSGILDRAIERVLKHHPHIVFVGEIRTEADARSIFRYCNSGPLFVCTLQSGSKREDVKKRFEGFGMEPEVIDKDLGLVIGQELVSRICQNCAEDFNERNSDFIERFFQGSDSADRLYREHEYDPKMRPKENIDCVVCEGRGWSGKVPAFEMWGAGTGNAKDLLVQQGTIDFSKSDYLFGLFWNGLIDEQVFNDCQ